MSNRKPRGSGPGNSPRRASSRRTPATGHKGGPFGQADYDRNLGAARNVKKNRPTGDQAEQNFSQVHQPEGERLQKVLAGAGVASRRVCEDLITEGRVEVDGVIVTELGVRVDPATAVIHVDGIRVRASTQQVYYAFNKPRGVISTMEDPEGRPCIADYVKDTRERLFHVGRLDNETEGLLVLTNDGELANRLAHPRYNIAKTYLVQVRGPLDKGIGKQLREGVELEDGLARVDSFRVVDSTPGHVLVEVVLHSGKNRVVRRMFKEVGYPVQRLVRVAMGPITLGNQKQGTVRPLNDQEIGHLMSAVKL
ncbi:pseudouridine synthase [Citricoccus muralis]|uniref:Pseudouridine synthase n=1 Tax=Citricoccus muralis TaxID=169134 RepID=A0ABY8H372_9MICC|nr:pseudouridine synthase [Citricoccus muralis]WFP15574.1 pseudouridine synthase [Citricoccus muralis]